MAPNDTFRRQTISLKPYNYNTLLVTKARLIERLGKNINISDIVNALLKAHSPVDENELKEIEKHISK